MRLFIAIEMNEALRDMLTDTMSFLRASGVTGGYTRRDNLHITLAFIGESEDVHRICQVMDGVRTTPFEIETDGYGCFGDTLWAGVRENRTLTALADELRTGLIEAGFVMERRPYKPHITLVRKVSQHTGLGLRMPCVSMPVSSIVLMRSDRIDGRLTYTPVYRRIL